MAITLTGTRTAVNIKLNNGTDSQGRIKTVSINLGSMVSNDFSAEDCQKAVNVIKALTPCLDKSVLSMQKTHVDSMTENV